MPPARRRHGLRACAAEWLKPRWHTLRPVAGRAAYLLPRRSAGRRSARDRHRPSVSGTAEAAQSPEVIAEPPTIHADAGASSSIERAGRHGTSCLVRQPARSRIRLIGIGGSHMSSGWLDLRYAVRALVREAGATVIAVLTLG